MTRQPAVHMEYPPDSPDLSNLSLFRVSSGEDSQKDPPQDRTVIFRVRTLPPNSSHPAHIVIDKTSFKPQDDARIVELTMKTPVELVIVNDFLDENGLTPPLTLSGGTAYDINANDPNQVEWLMLHEPIHKYDIRMDPNNITRNKRRDVIAKLQLDIKGRWRPFMLAPGEKDTILKLIFAPMQP